MSYILQLDSVCKSYPRISGGNSRLRLLVDALLNRAYTDKHDIIKSISLDLKKGESLGIIGENGAGKSTLLKLIAGVLKPNSGSVTLNGKVAALLELGAGFHPEYSGMENIRMNAALSGLSSKKMRQKLDQIIEFADIGDYIYEPIKHYSSGMVVRLGFAMITALDPELLITDEVLAVGDESFQKKCISWMENYLNSGGSLLLCSHGMYHIQKLCNKAIWLEKGSCRAYGSSIDVTKKYLAFHEAKLANSSQKVEQLKSNSNIDDEDAASNGYYYIKSAKLLDKDNVETTKIVHGEDLKIRGIIYSPDSRVPTVGFGLNKLDGLAIYGMTSSMITNVTAAKIVQTSYQENITEESKAIDLMTNKTSTTLNANKLKKIDDNHYEFCLVLPKIQVLPGDFIINLHGMDPEAMRLFDTYELRFSIIGNTMELGSIFVQHYWE